MGQFNLISKINNRQRRRWSIYSETPRWTSSAARSFISGSECFRFWQGAIRGQIKRWIKRLIRVYVYIYMYLRGNCALCLGNRPTTVSTSKYFPRRIYAPITLVFLSFYRPFFLFSCCGRFWHYHAFWVKEWKMGKLDGFWGVGSFDLETLSLEFLRIDVAISSSQEC